MKQDEEDELMKEYFEQLEKEKLYELSKHSKEIEGFREFTKQCGIELDNTDFTCECTH